MNFEEFRVLPKGKKEEYLFEAVSAIADHMNVTLDADIFLSEDIAPNAQEGYTEAPANE